MSEHEERKLMVLRRSRGRLHAQVEPIVLEYRERKRKKKGDVSVDEEENFSEDLADLQLLDRDMVRVARRSARALSKSIDTYDEERKRSAEEKRDGAVEDFAHNTAKAASAYLKEASEIPMDIAEALDTRSLRERRRKSLRQASRIIRLFRI